jgi:hypothetical protein
MHGSWREPMSGYTPVFKSVFTGSLTGKWPDTGLWVSLLALADKNGELDYTPQYISMVTGLDLTEVEDCLLRFTQPDPMSRSGTDEGRRLVLTDPNRTWGWRIVNFVAYREKARLSAKNAREVEEGRNRERLATRNDSTAADRRSPPLTAADPLSNTNTDTDKKNVAKSDCHLVFDHWKTVHGHPGAVLDAVRDRKIRGALKNYTAAQLCEAIDGYKKSTWHQGANKDGTVYDSLELMLRNAEKIDAGIKYANGGTQKWL